MSLELNGKPLGTKQPGEDGRGLGWEIPFEPGMLKAAGRQDGKAVCEYVLRTAGKAAGITLSPDCDVLKADGRDVCLIRFEVTDENGVAVPDAADSVRFTLSGPAVIAAVGNGDPRSHESHQGSMHKVFGGRGLLILRTQKQPGRIELEAVADGLKTAKLVLEAR